MKRNDCKSQGCTITLIICAVFAAIVIACSWTSRVSGVFGALTLPVGAMAVSFEPVPAIIGAGFVLAALFSGIFCGNRVLRIIFSALVCAIAASWLIPLGGLKTQMLAEAFARSAEKAPRFRWHTCAVFS